MAETTEFDKIKAWIDGEILKHEAQMALLRAIDFSNPSLAIEFRDPDFLQGYLG